METRYVIAGTGHRPSKLGGYAVDAYDKLKDIASNWLSELGPKKPTKVISGMALGWDQALAEAAIELKIPTLAAVPFKGQESTWPMISQYKYKRILDLCSEVIIVSAGGYAAHKMELRNRWMVDNADAIVAMWDGTDGGTANCIRYANSVNKPIHNLYSIWKS